VVLSPIAAFNPRLSGVWRQAQPEKGPVIIPLQTRWNYVAEILHTNLLLTEII
jgi:hypothetical protein